MILLYTCSSLFACFSNLAFIPPIFLF